MGLFSNWYTENAACTWTVLQTNQTHSVVKINKKVTHVSTLLLSPSLHKAQQNTLIDESLPNRWVPDQADVSLQANICCLGLIIWILFSSMKPSQKRFHWRLSSQQIIISTLPFLCMLIGVY